ncbi:GNAT family N-acetyltransferase [Daejeonella sp.]|jgi:RimJ/RimL family protein N-acetyltransferase|uniref:GNAT family N-acetyltransferase n=1 Tax=Daejeonella sp. TaxID=2805397 RepID=UPI0037BF4B37
MNYILETERLALRELNENDASFILELLNTDGWLKYIGDRNVKSEDQASDYLMNGPIKSYKDNGYGLYLVELKSEKIPIGMCGIIKRDNLELPDIGYAFLPMYYGLGYAFEAAKQTLNYAEFNLNLNKILAITNPDNFSSIKLLEKLGFAFQKFIKAPHDGAELRLFSKILGK